MVAQHHEGKTYIKSYKTIEQRGKRDYSRSYKASREKCWGHTKRFQNQNGFRFRTNNTESLKTLGLGF